MKGDSLKKPLVIILYSLVCGGKMVHIIRKKVILHRIDRMAYLHLSLPKFLEENEER